MNITVVGTGYVGVVTAACFAEFGVQVVGVDKDDAKIDLLQKGQVPFFEPGLQELLTKGVENGLIEFTSDTTAAVAGADVALPLPSCFLISRAVLFAGSILLFLARNRRRI